MPFPPELPRLKTVNVGAAYGSARRGGDFFEFITPRDGQLVYAMLDIAGRRDGALRIASAVQKILRERSTGLVAESGNLNDALSALALEMNRTIIDEASGVHNCPAFLAGLDEATGTLSYINAGHIPALLSDEDGISECGAGGVPFGLFSHVVHEARMVVIRPGAVLLIASKGLVEAKSGTREFGLEGVRNVLRTRAFGSAEELCGKVLREAERFAATPSFWGPRLAFSGFADEEPTDMTAVALMRPAEGRTVSAMAG